MTGEIEAVREVTDRYFGLSGSERDVVAIHIDLLGDLCHLLRTPHSRQFGEGLAERRFDRSRRSWRTTYWHRRDKVNVLLTVLHKRRDNEAGAVV